jgi:hypothetical protein
VSGRAWWVLSPTDGQAHLLALEGSGAVVLTTQCGQSLPSGLLRHDRLPSRDLCRDCVAAYVLPAAVLARMTPAGRRSSGPVRSPGDQPVPHPSEQASYPSEQASCGCPAPAAAETAR